jgi:hypothetical protein
MFLLAILLALVRLNFHASLRVEEAEVALDLISNDREGNHLGLGPWPSREDVKPW